VGPPIDHAQALGKHVTLSRSRRWRSLIRGENMWTFLNDCKYVQLHLHRSPKPRRVRVLLGTQIGRAVSTQTQTCTEISGTCTPVRFGDRRVLRRASSGRFPAKNRQHILTWVPSKRTGEVFAIEQVHFLDAQLGEDRVCRRLRILLGRQPTRLKSSSAVCGRDGKTLADGCGVICENLCST
jgi:hypothetical protein